MISKCSATLGSLPTSALDGAADVAHLAEHPVRANLDRYEVDALLGWELGVLGRVGLGKGLQPLLLRARQGLDSAAEDACLPQLHFDEDERVAVDRDQV